MFTKTATQAGRGPYSKPATSAVRRMRLSKGMTQVDCARFVRVSLRTFQRIESGDVVPIEVKRRVERALGAAW